MSNPYLVRVQRWSQDNDLAEALNKVRKEVDRKLETIRLPLAVRVEVIEKMLLEIGAMTTFVIAYPNTTPLEAVDMVKVAIEFLRLDLLFDAIEMYELQRGQKDG